jgi:sulfopropanediol 3-dehydrogenase
MTITYLKSGKPAAERADDDAKVRGIVESTLKDIETRGDTAVRELSEKFDKFSPPSFRLSPSEIEAAMNTFPPATWRTLTLLRPRSVVSRKPRGLR